MTIGIDIDDTITYTTKRANEILHQNDEYKMVKDYHDLPDEIKKEFVDKNLTTIVQSSLLKEDVKEVLNKWHQEKIKIIFISARGSYGQYISIPLTSLYFKKHDIYFDELIFMKDKKGSCAYFKKIDLFIDDKESVLDDIKTYGIKTLRITTDKSKHDTAKTWLEVQKYVEAMGDNYGR